MWLRPSGRMLAASCAYTHPTPPLVVVVGLRRLVAERRKGV